ncbi:MAG: hypothetical protein GY906_06515 [bacterium]|nr:hypothetical protein [bacterium]
MQGSLKHKLYMGFRGIMLRIPPLLSERGAKRGAQGARENAGRLAAEERRVHHHIVLKMLHARTPFTTEIVADEMGIENSRMQAIVDKLEHLKTFVFRSDGKRIDWAYPLSLENTGFQMSASSGERFFAA